MESHTGKGKSQKRMAAKAARCGVCKACANPQSKRPCLDPKGTIEAPASAPGAHDISKRPTRSPAPPGAAYTPTIPDYRNQRHQTREQQSVKRKRRGEKSQQATARAEAKGVGRAVAALGACPSLVDSDDVSDWLEAAGFLLSDDGGRTSHTADKHTRTSPSPPQLPSARSPSNCATTGLLRLA